MQAIFKSHAFKIQKDEVGVDTTTITAPEGFKFFYFNNRFSHTLKDVYDSILRTNDGLPVDKMTVAGSYDFGNWPFVIMTQEQVDTVVETQQKFEELQELAREADNTRKLVFAHLLD